MTIFNTTAIADARRVASSGVADNHAPLDTPKGSGYGSQGAQGTCADIDDARSPWVGIYGSQGAQGTCADIDDAGSPWVGIYGSQGAQGIHGVYGVQSVREKYPCPDSDGPNGAVDVDDFSI